jgi:hypothetical protein
MVAILTRYSQEHVTIKMLASYLKNLPTKPMREDDPLDSNWPFNHDMDDRRVSFENLEYLYSKFLHHRRVSLSRYKSNI